MARPDEFEVIARLMRPLAGPEALDLLDDAALITPPPGFDLVVTKDAIVEGVHFLSDDPLDTVARKLLRVNLSDLAAKGAKPHGYFLAQAWPDRAGENERASFAAGLAQDQAEFGVVLLGGDTVSTGGPMVFSATLLGWAPKGGFVSRSGARPGDLVMASGPIGDGWLGLKAALGEIDAPAVVQRYRLPTPRVDLSLAGATACADISDGLVADAGRIAIASDVRIVLDLARMPLSEAGRDWTDSQANRAEALKALATGGDDYQLVATAPALLAGFTAIGRVEAGQGIEVRIDGQPVALDRAGWVHGKDG